MGWGTAREDYVRPPKDPILAAIATSPEGAKRVKKWAPKEPKVATPRTAPVFSFRPGATRAATKAFNVGHAIQPSLLAQFERAKEIARIAKLFEEAGKLRRQHAAKAMQRAERRRQERAHAATSIQRIERGRQCRRREEERAAAEWAAAQAAAEAAAAAAAAAAAEHAAAERAAAENAARQSKVSPIPRMFSALSAMFASGGGGPSSEYGDGGAVRARRVAVIREKLRAPLSVSVEQIAAMVPMPGASVGERVDTLYERVVAAERARKLQAVREVLRIPPSMSDLHIARTVPVEGSVDERIDALYERIRQHQMLHEA